jgi:undecaprenyl-diphosphatase
MMVGAQRMEDGVVVSLNRLVRGSGLLRNGTLALAQGLASVEVGLMVLLALRGRRDTAARMLGAVGLVYVVSDVLGTIWRRQRPFARLSEVRPLAAHGADRSFPSRHVASGLAMAVIGARAHPRLGSIMTCAAWALGVSRVVVGLHYPSDVLAGAALGTLIGRWLRSAH